MIAAVWEWIVALMSGPRSQHSGMDDQAAATKLGMPLLPRIAFEIVLDQGHAVISSKNASEC